MKIKAFNLSRSSIGFYLTAMSPNQLFSISRVDRVSENAEEGFQRQLDEPRVNKISKYVKDKIIPGAIILSARRGTSINFDSETSELFINPDEERMLVIDGQHRLFGSKKAEDQGVSDILLPVCILTGLELVEEVNYFIDINSTQKGVPKTLRIELTKFLVEAESIDEIRLRLFKDLNTEVDSPLCGKMTAEQKGPGYLSHVPFEIAINKILNTNRMEILDYEGKKQLLKNYLSGVYENLLEEGYASKITQSAFFQAIFRVFDKACENAIIKHKNYKKESFQSIFSILGRINFEIHSGSNDEAVNKLERDLIDKLDLDSKTAIKNDLF